MFIIITRSQMTVLVYKHLSLVCQIGTVHYEILKDSHEKC